MNPKFGMGMEMNHDLNSGSPDSVRDMILVRKNPLFTAREKVKLRASHSNVYKDIGKQLGGVMPRNLCLMRQNQLLTDELKK